jgi:hypothetical protein
MKLKLIASIVSTALLTVSAAHAMPAKPDKCPGANSLQSISFEAVEQDNDGTWAAGVMGNNYDTKDRWTFVIGKIQANSESDAKAKAVEAAKSLKFRQGPLPIEQYGVWACVYSNAKNYPAITVTPAFGLHSASKLAV